MKVIKIIAIYEIIGSIIGLGFGVNLLFNERISQYGIWVTIPFLILYFVLGLAGIQLLRAKKIGLLLSYIVQSLQVVSFSLRGLKLIFNAGTSLLIGFSEAEFQFEIKLIDIQFKFGTEMRDEFFLINLVPILIVILLNSREEELTLA